MTNYTHTQTQEIKIVETEVLDWNNERDDGDCEMGAVEVLVTALVGNDELHLRFQTQGTFDCGAVDSELRFYDEGEDIDEDTAEEIGKMANVQEKFNDYIEANYEKDESWFGGIDGRSEHNKMQRKQENGGYENENNHTRTNAYQKNCKNQRTENHKKRSEKTCRQN